MRKRILVTVESANDLFSARVRSALDASASGTLTCKGVDDLVEVLRQRLETLFVAGDKIEFASMLFNSVGDAIRAVEISCGRTPRWEVNV